MVDEPHGKVWGKGGKVLPVLDLHKVSVKLMLQAWTQSRCYLIMNRKGCASSSISSGLSRFSATGPVLRICFHCLIEAAQQLWDLKTIITPFYRWGKWSSERVPAASKSWSQYLKSASQAVKLAFLTTTPGHPQGGGSGDNGSGKGWGCKSRKASRRRWDKTGKWEMKTPSPSGQGLGRNAAKLLRRRQWQPTPVLLPGKSHGWEEWVFHKEGAALGLPWWLTREESVWRPQLLKPEHLEPMLYNKRSHSNKKHLHCN